MKDAKGHGSNSKGVAKAAGYSVERRPPLGYFIRTPAGAEHGPYFKEHGAWKDAANLSKPDAAAQLREGSGSKSDTVPNHDGTIGRHGYNPESVDKAINSASRYQGKVSGKERSAIHRLLRGRG